MFDWVHLVVLFHHQRKCWVSDFSAFFLSFSKHTLVCMLWYDCVSVCLRITASQQLEWWSGLHIIWQADQFTVEAVSLGKLKRVIVGHDGTNPGKLVGFAWLLTYLCPSLPVEHRPSTTPRHRTLFWAALVIPDQLVPCRWRPFLAQVSTLVSCRWSFSNMSFLWVGLLALHQPLYPRGELFLP